MGNLKKFLHAATTNGGATYNINTGELNPDSGFASAIHGREEVVSQLTDEYVSKFINENIDVLGRNDYFLGVWKSKGKYVLDVVKIYDDLKEALISSKIANQEFIYDLAKDKEIKVPKPQKCGTITQQQTHFNLQVQKIVDSYGQ